MTDKENKEYRINVRLDKESYDKLQELLAAHYRITADMIRLMIRNEYDKLPKNASHPTT